GLNPAMILQLLKARQGAGGGAPGAPGGGDDTGGVSRELQGSDPEYASKLVTDIKKKIMDLIPTQAFKAPAAARALASTMKGVDTALKELNQAQQTMQAVGGPMGLSAVSKQQPPGGQPELRMGA